MSSEESIEILTTLKKMDLERQSIPITKPNSEDGEIRRHIDFVDDLLSCRNPTVTTLYENWRNGADNWPQNDCFGTKPFGSNEFQFISYEEADKQISRVASFLVKCGFGEEEHIGIYGKNSPRWVITGEACNFQKYVSVALYDTLGKENLEYVVNHAELKIVFGTVDKLVDLLTMVENLEFLEHVVPMYSAEELNGQVDDDVYQKMLKWEEKLADLAEDREIQVTTWKDVQRRGKKSPAEPNPPSPDDLAIIMYTSGTTGHPKGVMITHGNLISAVDSGYLQLGGLFAEKDSYLSYLPLAHVFERAIMAAMVQNGVTVGFYGGDPRNLTADISSFKPTVLAGVPRVFDKIYEGITGRVDAAGGISKFIFKSAYKDREKAKAKGKKSKSLFDNLAFKKAKKALGGRVRLIVSGGAPLSATTQEFISLVFGCPVLQGYGLTETCASCTMSCTEDTTVGQVGPPTPSCEVKLVAIPEMNYYPNTKPPCGEVWIRGPTVTQGYYKQPEKTAEDFDEEGWFHTGDVGRWNENGTLSIIDRKKNIFKLAQGEYVAAELLEGFYSACRFTSQFWVYGNSEESYLVAVAVVNPDTIRSIAHSDDLEEICEDPEVIAQILHEINEIATARNRAGFERIKKIKLYHEEWTTENNLATPTMKLKRPQLREFFQEDIDRMYEEIREETSGKKKKTKKTETAEPVNKKRRKQSKDIEESPEEAPKRRKHSKEEAPKRRKKSTEAHDGGAKRRGRRRSVEVSGEDDKPKHRHSSSDE